MAKAKKSKFFKYWLCVLLACITVFGCGSSAAFAVSATNMDSTPVLQDLQESTIAGEKFDVSKFPYNENGKTKVIAFTEFCFSYKASLAGNYALYVYIYNPTGREIRQDKNSIQLASVYSDGQAVRYEKFNMLLCNFSSGGLDKLFYKFRVIDDGSIFERVCKDNTARRYDVSGIELNYTGTAEDFTVGNKWVYSGFAKGCGNDENAESTLSCITDDLETVRLDVTGTYYRYNNGLQSQTQIDSVYFGVDNVLLQKYGTLQKIHAEWLKAVTSDIVVMENKSAYDHLKDNIGVDVAGNNFNYCLWYPLDQTSNVYWGYNIDGYERVDKLAYIIDKSGTDGAVSSAEMQDYIKWYSEKFGNKTVAGKYSADLFSQVDDKKTDIEIDADSTFNLDGFTSGSSFYDWFYSWLLPDLQQEEIKGITPIYMIKESDLTGSNEEIAKRLFVAVDDVDKIKAEFEANKKVAKTTVLFRFATSQYSSMDISLHKHGDLIRIWNKVGYKAKETVYLDFDIIDLTFMKNDVATVIPVVSNPIDVIPGIDPPPSASSPEIPWWVWLIIGLLCLVLLVLFVKPVAEVVLFVLKIVWTIVSAPFRLIIWLCKKIFNRGAK